MTGAELAALRRTAQLSQTDLGRLAGIGRQAVSYWECKAVVDLRAYALRKIGAVLSLPPIRTELRAGGGWGLSVPVSLRTPCAKTLRKRCGAKTRKGTPCAAQSLPGKQRCKFHGGMSTGPKTIEGRDRIAQAQRTRWARQRIVAQNKASHNLKLYVYIW